MMTSALVSELDRGGIWRNRITGYGEEPPDQLLANPSNWRVHPKSQQEALAGVLSEVGWVQNVIVNRRTGHLIDGHLRVTLAMRRHEQTVPVLYVDLSEDEERLVLATLDPITSLATADREQLDALLRQVSTGDAAVQQMLADMAKAHGLEYGAPEAVSDPGAEPDRAEELQRKWQTDRGQLWEIPSGSMPGKMHRLLCGDSTNAEDVRRLMAGQRAVLFATDPPYLVDYDGTNHPHKWGEHDNNMDWSESYNDWDNPSQGEALYDAFIGVAVAEAITDDAAWYCWHASKNQAMVERVWEKYGAFVHQQIIWAKDRPVLTRSWYMWQHEPCFFGWRKGHKPRRVDSDFLSSVWQVATSKPGQHNDHPTSKPVELFAIPMRQHTRIGDICYEPFAGSGSQYVAGEQERRVVFGVEIQPQFVAVILERLRGIGLEPRLSDA